MAIIGNWSSLEEAQKIVQHELLLAGVVEEIIKEGEVMPRLPVMQIDSKELIYYREKSLPSANYYAKGGQMSWDADTDYGDKQTVELAIAGGQRRIDKFMRDTYKNPNDYRAQVMKELTKGLTQWLEKEFIYGSGATNHCDGLRYLLNANSDASMTAVGGTTNQNAALSIANLRCLVDAVRPKPDILLMNRDFARKFDAFVQEGAIETSAGAGQVFGSRMTTTVNNLGERVAYFDGIPIVRSDFLVATEAAAGTYSTTGTATSIYAIRFGQIMEGGVCMVTGGQGGEIGRILAVDTFDKLEDYNAEGVRVIGYFNFALGSTKGAARIRNITSASAITA